MRYVKINLKNPSNNIEYLCWKKWYVGFWQQYMFITETIVDVNKWLCIYIIYYYSNFHMIYEWIIVKQLRFLLWHKAA